MRPVPSGLTNTFGVHEPPWPAVRGIRRVTLLEAPAVTVKLPLREPDVPPLALKQSSPQATSICCAGLAHTCTEMEDGWLMSPCTEQDTKSPSVVQFPMYTVPDAVTALAVATPAPASRTAAARTGTMRFTVKSLGPRRPGGYDAPMKGDGTLPHGACGSHVMRDYCAVFWGSHGCGRRRGHRGHHRCGPCRRHPWWAHAVLHWLGHGNGCVERWPYYGRRRTVFYGEDAPVKGGSSVR